MKVPTNNMLSLILSVFLSVLSASATPHHPPSYATPPKQSLCDKYTTALLKDNTAKNQQTLLTLVVNTAVIGNYTQPNVGISVPGILAPGTGKFKGVDLAPYFNAKLKSTNAGGDRGVAVNFLDGGGAEPLKMNMPGAMGSNQSKLLTHLYSYFGSLLGCSLFSNTTAKYEGSTSMYNTHKFMALSNAEVQYFITQVGLSAASFGVSKEDVATVGMALQDAFGFRCLPKASIPMGAKPELQSICIEKDCPLSKKGKDCKAYEKVVEPKAVA